MYSEASAWILVGPTATGKTAVANELARRTGAVVLSADSMLVYRGMDIGTAKPTLEERRGLSFYGVDCVEPCEGFSVGAWLETAVAAVRAARETQRDLIVVGGTGLYVNALLEGLDAPPADPVLRAELETLAQTHGVEGLRARAEALEAGVTQRLSDAANPRRLIRLIERLATGQTLGRTSLASLNRPVVGLHCEPAVLAQRIEQRIEAMFRMGLLDEVRALQTRYSAFSTTAGKGIGYAETLAVLDGRLTETAAKEAIAIRTRQLAKRQRTWFRTQLSVTWVPGPSSTEDIGHVADAVWALWQQQGKTPLRILEPGGNS